MHKFFSPVGLDEANLSTWCQQTTPKLLVEIDESKREKGSGYEVFKEVANITNGTFP